MNFLENNWYEKVRLLTYLSAVTLGIDNLLLFQRLMSVDDVLELVVCCQIGLVFNKHFSLLEYGYFGPEILKFVAKKTEICSLPEIYSILNLLQISGHFLDKVH